MTVKREYECSIHSFVRACMCVCAYACVCVGACSKEGVGGGAGASSSVNITYFYANAFFCFFSANSILMDRRPKKEESLKELLRPRHRISEINVPRNTASLQASSNAHKAHMKLTYVPVPFGALLRPVSGLHLFLFFFYNLLC